MEFYVFNFNIAKVVGRPYTHCMRVVFQGRIESVPLFLTSSFLNPITVFSTAVKAHKPFTFVPVEKSDIQLAPNIRQKVKYSVLLLSILVYYYSIVFCKIYLNAYGFQLLFFVDWRCRF